jgi:hypothetical protein
MCRHIDWYTLTNVSKERIPPFSRKSDYPEEEEEEEGGGGGGEKGKEGRSHSGKLVSL